MAEDQKMPPIAVSADGHEHRIQKLEAGQSELTTRVAVNEKEIGYFKSELLGIVGGIKDSVDAGIERIEKRLQEGDERMGAMGERIGEQGTKINEIEGDKRRSAERWDGLKKWMIPAFTGAIAIGLKELAVFIFKHL